LTDTQFGPSGADSWNRDLSRALNRSESPNASSTWIQLDADATPLPEPGPAPALKPPAEGALLAEPYKVIGEVGRGGIGIVLQARDLTLGREVAVKVLQPKHQTNVAAVTRFTREAKIAAQLQHPGIVPVYAAGQDNLDRPYIAMKLLRGSTLEALLEKRKDPREGRAGFIRIFEQVCQTMAYAHSRGVIHRDLKPGNIMVGAFGEVQIIDWGFARVLGSASALEDAKDAQLLTQAASSQESSALSVAGVPIGTPAYMAPEQAKGELKAIDERTDVYCLGSILTEILTGRPPHASSSVREVMEEAVRGDVTPACERLDRSGAEAELIALAKDCLRSAKDARPRNAAAVAERVSAFLAAAADRARQAELEADRERSRVAEERRKRRVLGWAAVVTLLAGAGVAWAFWARAERRQLVADEVGVLLADADGRARDGEWAAAEQLALRADAVLNVNDAGRQIRAKVAQKLEEYRVGAREEETAHKLSDLRMSANSPPHEMDLRYAEAFLAIGIDIDRQDPESIGQWIRARKRVEIQQKFLLALDDWSLRFGPPGGGPEGPPPDRPRVGGPPQPGRTPRGGPDAPPNPERRRRVIEAAIHADKDEWRNDLRRAIQADQREKLRSLAGSIETTKPTPTAASIILLSHALGGSPDGSPIDILLRAYRLYPEDYWINFFIADASLPVRGNTDPRRAELCERHARLAVSLNPRNSHAHALLAAALLGRMTAGRGRTEDRAEVISLLEKAKLLDGGPFGEVAKRALRAIEGTDPDARVEARRWIEAEPNPPPLIRALFENLPR
jgi:serine/threonine-protein kinase